MALIKCPECEREVSDKAVDCPHCGCPLTSDNQLREMTNENQQIKECKYCKTKIEKNAKVCPNCNRDLNGNGCSKGCSIATIAFIILVVFLMVLLSKCEGPKGPIETYCYWCGKKEECYTYELQHLDGYNPDGSFKFGYDVENMSTDCAEKCKNSGKYFNVKKVD